MTSLFALRAIALSVLLALPVAGHGQLKNGADGHMHNSNDMSTKQQQEIEATGVINTIDPPTRSVNLSHEPIPAIGWPSMTMDLKAADTVDLSGIEAGSPATFTLERGSDGIYMITGIEAAK